MTLGVDFVDLEPYRENYTGKLTESQKERCKKELEETYKNYLPYQVMKN